MMGEPAFPMPAEGSATTVALACPSPSASSTRPSMTAVRTSLKPIRVAGAVIPHFSICGSQPNFEARRK